MVAYRAAAVRLGVRWEGFAVVRLLLLVSLAVALVACSESPKLAGTAFDPPQPAPDFTLTDQRGQSVQLSSYRGDAVALTFIYTNCTDVCPLIAEKLRRAYDALPPATQQKVQLLAVTVDPARDDRQALQDFSAKHQLADNPHWHAMTGDQSVLEQVWKGYYIYPGQMMGTDAATPGSTTVHTDAIVFIDPKGERRALLDSAADPNAIAANLKALAG